MRLRRPASQNLPKAAQYNVTARVTGLPWYAKDGCQLLHLGLSYSHKFRGNDYKLRYRARPETHLAQRFVDTAMYDSDLATPTNSIDLLAAEPALRGSHLNLDSRDITGGKLTDLTAAVNWYLFPNVRLQTNFVWAQRDKIGDAFIYQMRAQIDF